MENAMLDVLLIVLGLFAACLVTELFSAAAAPLGYQDESGFRFGTEPNLHSGSVESENPS